MLDLTKIEHVYFLGVGGIGMSSLARFFNSKGVKVYGYDLTETKLTRQLTKEGIDIHYLDEPQSIPLSFLVKSITHLVIYTPAIPSTNKELNCFINKGVSVYKRAELLGQISKSYFSIAVAGTHGKTTTASILAHLFLHQNESFCAFIGGILKDTKTNYYIQDKGQEKEQNYCILEADEYDKSFLHIFPQIAIVTSCDTDHLDIYKTKENLHDTYLKFVNQVEDSGTLIIHEKALSLVHKLPSNVNYITYGFSKDNDVYIHGIETHPSKTTFSLTWEGTTYDELTIKMIGKHNVLNATAAIITCINQGLPIKALCKGLSTFKGIDRRMDTHINEYPYLYIDDYAHHPTELMHLINAVKDIRKDDDIHIVFQPHLYSRTKDFAVEFAQVLSTVKKVYLLDIYPARELPIAGVDSKIIGEKISAGTHVVYLSKNDLLQQINIDKPEVLLSVGAGDIDIFVEEIKAIYLKLLTAQV